MRKKGCGGGCLGAPMRALSRGCDLYVRGMSACARRVPSGASAGIVGRGFAGAGAASSLRQRVSSDGTDDLVRAATAAAARRHQRRVAAEPPAVGAEHGAGNKKKRGAAARQRRVAAEQAETVEYGAAGKKGGAPTRKKGGRGAAAAMGTIAEDEPCEFGRDGALCPPR